jgi:hypothetical protein
MNGGLLILVCAGAAVLGSACGGEAPRATPSESRPSAPADRETAASGPNPAANSEGSGNSRGDDKRSVNGRHGSTAGRRSAVEREDRIPAEQGYSTPPSKQPSPKHIVEPLEDIPASDRRILERRLDPSKQECREVPFIPGCDS